VPEAKEAAAGCREALEPALEQAKGNKLSAKGQLSKVMKTAISPSLVACMLLLAHAAAPPRALASGNANWGTGVELTAPANAAEDPEARLWHLSCRSAGNCTAVGSYDMPPEHKEEPPREQGELLSETDGRWGPAVEATMPANAASDPLVERFGEGALSCPSVGNCTAVGEYRDSAGHEQGFLISETAGTWGTAVEAPLPANVGPEPQVVLDRLSCPSAGNCTAVGNYTEPSRKGWQGFLVSETAGTWSTAAMVPSLPANASPNPEEPMPMGGVSCTSVGNCTAVGAYTDSSGDTEGFIWTETAGAWGTAVETTLPANAASNPGVELESLSCPSAGNCTAVGEYTDSSSHYEGLILGETSGTWGAGAEAIVPAGVPSETNANLHEVQCPSAGNCTVFGVFTNSEEHDREFLTETSGVWGPGVKLALPVNAAPQLVIEGSLSCPSAGDCSYVNDWKVNEFVSRALLATENDGTWAPSINGALPANATGDPGAFLSSVSCTAPGACTAVGSYNSYNGGSVVEREGMVFTAAPTTANLTVSGPLGYAFAGSPISASRVSATLAGGSDPTGAITFTVFGPQSSPPTSCVSGGTTVGTGNAYGDGTYQPSATFTPPSPGEYWWYASYGGDAGDEPSASRCGAGMAETTVVPKVAPTLSVSGPLGGVAESPISASSIAATLAGGSAPTGAIAFTVFGPQSLPPSSCVSGGTAVGTASVNGNGAYQPSADFTPAAPGEYWWYASYAGDAGDEPAASACGPLMAQTFVAAAPTTPSSSGSGSSGSGSGGESGTGAKTLAPTLSAVKLGSKSSTGKKGIALKLTLSQPATIKVLIAQLVKAHKLRGMCKPQAKMGKSCTTTVDRRTLTFSGSAGSNALKLKLAGLGEGSYITTITAENANGTSSAVRLAFTIINE
jgi:hypothetical protein